MHDLTYKFCDQSRYHVIYHASIPTSPEHTNDGLWLEHVHRDQADVVKEASLPCHFYPFQSATNTTSWE